jgi:hypothetical protein
MLRHIQGYRLFQSLRFRNDVLLKVQRRFCDVSNSEEIRSQVSICDWLHSVGQNHFYVMLLFNQGDCYIQSLPFR